MKRIACFVLAVFFSIIPTMVNASEIDILGMSFDELIALRTELDARIRELYPEYDYILDSGEYFINIDFPAGNVMLYYLREDGAATQCVVRNSDDEFTFNDCLAPYSPREKCVLADGDKLEIHRGPIGIKYLDD